MTNLSIKGSVLMQDIPEREGVKEKSCVDQKYMNSLDQTAVECTFPPKSISNMAPMGNLINQTA